MSYETIDKRSIVLHDVIIKDLGLTDEQSTALIDALTDLARAIADDEIDRLFNRGDYRS